MYMCVYLYIHNWPQIQLRNEKSSVHCECFKVFEIISLISFVEGFLIAHVHKALCLLNDSVLVKLGTCNATSPNQQWTWTQEDKLLHVHSSRCLWADISSSLPSHARLASLGNCSAAPSWSSCEAVGLLGVADSPLYLKKQGQRVVVKTGKRYSNWTKYEVDPGGKVVTGSLCAKKGELLCVVLFWKIGCNAAYTQHHRPFFFLKYKSGLYIKPALLCFIVVRFVSIEPQLWITQWFSLM